MDTNINFNKCMARKNMKNGINEQCTYNKKYGDFCGIHKKVSIINRIDSGNNLIKIIKNKKKNIIDINNFNGKDYSIKILKDYLEKKNIITTGKKKKKN